jgi:hypothetical protein
MRKRRAWIFGLLAFLLIGSGWWFWPRAPKFPPYLKAFESRTTYLGTAAYYSYIYVSGSRMTKAVFTHDSYLVKAPGKDVLENFRKQKLVTLRDRGRPETLHFVAEEDMLIVRQITLDGEIVSLVSIRTFFPPSTLDRWIIGFWPNWVKVRFGNDTLPK